MNCVQILNQFKSDCNPIIGQIHHAWLFKKPKSVPIDIVEVFFGNPKINEDGIIKTVLVDEMIHKNGIKNLLKYKITGYDFDECNEPIINKLFNYFTGNKSFCNDNQIDLKKGILMVGGVGTGKSILMDIFKIYTCLLKQNSFQYHYSQEIIDNVTINGIKYLEKFNHNFNGAKAYPITCYIDDICSKNEHVKNYGTDINVIEELISIRYNIYTRYNKLTHFSTNIYPAEMYEIYDARITSRLTEMCNIIELSGDDRRH